MRVLVVYGSKRGGTAGLAKMVSSALAGEGIDADVRPAADRVRNVGAYDAVIVGGALYAKRWHRQARHFVRRHARKLHRTAVWLFSSGPLDDSATAGGIAPVAQVSRLMQKVGARGHMTFGGRLTADAKGFPASAMAKKHAGDWRDENHVRRWVRIVATDLKGSASVEAADTSS